MCGVIRHGALHITPRYTQHNHPSGDPSPSEADIKVTRDLMRGGQLLRIEVLDHVIIGRASVDQPKPFSSLRELGFFYAA